MRNLTVARRYAKALYQLALENKSVDDVIQGMNNICVAMKTTDELKRSLFHPLIPPPKKQQLLKAVTSNPLILKFAGLLARRKRLDLLPWVYQELLSLGDQAKGIHRATIKTAIPLTDAQRKQVETDLAKSLGGTVVGRFEVDAALIGGLWVKLGDRVLDATLKGKIEDFRVALTHSRN